MTQRQVIEAIYMAFVIHWSDPQRVIAVWTGRRD
jgi:hypothetical protein